jgi:hypothetical protein
MAHEMGGLVEGFASVVQKNAGVDACVHDQETDEKQPGKAHQEFLAYGGGEEGFPGHM